MNEKQTKVVDTHKEGSLFTIRLNRPDQLNAFNRNLYSQVNEAIAEFNKDPDCRVAIITGTGRAFSAGVDIKEILKIASEQPHARMEDHASSFSVDMEDIEISEKPVIAAINGLCYGEGLALAISCDLRIAVEGTKFSMPEVKVGLASIHGNMRMVQNIGLGNALEMLLMGEPVDTDWALRTGLVNKVVTAEQLMPSARKWAEAIAVLDPQAIRRTREVAVKSHYLDFDGTVDLGLGLRDGTVFKGKRD